MVNASLASRILALLDQRESLSYDQVAATLDEPARAVRDALSRLRGLGFVDTVTVGELDADAASPAGYWRLTDAGCEKLAHLRAGGRAPRA